MRRNLIHLIAFAITCVLAGVSGAWVGTLIPLPHEPVIVRTNDGVTGELDIDTGEFTPLPSMKSRLRRESPVIESPTPSHVLANPMKARHFVDRCAHAAP